MQSYQRFQCIGHTDFKDLSSAVTNTPSLLPSMGKTGLGAIVCKTVHVRFRTRKRVHTRLSEKDRTQRLTRRNRGRFGWGWYHYPRSVLCGSETLRGWVSERCTLPLLGLGRVCSRRTQKAFGTAMRLCASLFRGVAAPLGCAVLVPLFVQYDLEGWKDLTKRSGRVTITRNNRTTSRLALVWKPRWAVK